MEKKSRRPVKRKQPSLYNSDNSDESIDSSPILSSKKLKLNAVIKKDSEVIKPKYSTSASFFLGDGKFEDKSPILLSSWNVNGIRASIKKGDLLDYIKSNDPDIIFLNETKIDKDAFKKENPGKSLPKDYFQYWNFCSVKKGYSGTAILSKIKPISIIEGMGIEENDNEGRILAAEYEKFYMVGIYHPNCGEWKFGAPRLEYCQSWHKDFMTFLSQLQAKKHVLLTGDFQVSHKDIDFYDFDSSGRKVKNGTPINETKRIDDYIGMGLQDSYRVKRPEERKFTHWSIKYKCRPKGFGWRFDYWFVDEKAMDFVKDSMIADEQMGSDHCPVELLVDTKKMKNKF